MAIAESRIRVVVLLAAMWATLVKWLAEIRGEMFPPAGGLTRGSIHVDPGRLTGGLRACRWRRGSDCYARVGYRRTMCSDWSRFACLGVERGNENRCCS